MSIEDKYATQAQRRKMAQREYQSRRQDEAAQRIRLLVHLVYGKDAGGRPLLRVADLLDGADATPSGDLRPETVFALGMIVDHMLNDGINARPTPQPPMPDGSR